MKILCIKDIIDNGKSRAVASLTDEDVRNIEMLKKLKSLEGDLKDCGMVVRKDGMFEIVEVPTIEMINAQKILYDGKPLCEGLEQFIKVVESEVEEYRKEAEKAAAEEAKVKEAEFETERQRLVRLSKEAPDLFCWEMHGIEPTESGYYD